MRSTRLRQRGASLITILPILALLALFLVALASLVRLERSATANRLEHDRAKLAAEAGLERALYLIGDQQLQRPLASLHSPWAYRNQDGSTWGADFPLEHSRQPSCKAGTLLPSGIAYSGIVSQTFGADIFALKVTDCSSRINLNGGNVAHMLDSLGRAILEFDERRADGRDPLHDAEWLAWRQEMRLFPLDPIRGRGARVAALRDSLDGSFTDIQQLLGVLTFDEIDALRPYVTLDSWRDPRHGLVAPVNVNTAPWPVLVACVEGLSEGGASIDADMARAIASALTAGREDPARGPYASIPDLLPAVDQALAGASDALTLRSVFISNAHALPFDFAKNPPSHIRRMGADAPFEDLDQKTTPFCFSPNGRFEVISLGRVVAKDGLVIAEAKLRTVVEVYDIIRLTTQEDFEVTRADDDEWSIESYPNPVAGMAGPKRFKVDGENVLIYTIRSAGKRRALRWRIGDPFSGYLGPGYNELDVEVTDEIDQVHAFRFNPDLKGTIYDSSGLRREVDRPNAQPFGVAGGNSPADQVYAYAEASGVSPRQLGEPGAPNPLPQEQSYAQILLEPDGLISSPERTTDLRYSNATPGLPVLSSSMAIQMRFRISDEGGQEWAPLLEARIRPDTSFAGLDPTKDYVDIQVEVAKRGGTKLYVRTRVNTSSPTPVPPIPGFNPAIAISPNSFEQQFEFDTAPLSPVNEWHVLYIPMHQKANTVFVDGRRLPLVGGDSDGDGLVDVPGVPDPWPLPAWTTMGLDTVVPAGLAEPRGQQYPRVTIDDFIVTQYKDGGALGLLRSAFQTTSGTAFEAPGMPRRFRMLGTDLMGSFVGQLPAFPDETVRIGPLLWTEVLPDHWNELVYPASDFMTRVTSAFPGDPNRNQVCSRWIPAPEPARLNDPFVRYWRARYLESREEALNHAVELYTRLAAASSQPPDPAAERTYNALARAFQEQVDEVRRERNGLGNPSAGGTDEPSAAFGPMKRLRSNQEKTLRFRIDFLYLGENPEEVAAAIDELIVPFQTRMQVLRKEWE